MFKPDPKGADPPEFTQRQGGALGDTGGGLRCSPCEYARVSLNDRPHTSAENTKYSKLHCIRLPTHLQTACVWIYILMHISECPKVSNSSRLIEFACLLS